ncbi:hypothetical protein TgHK011_000474 [Trichoderma gracile]|nr:hypothetical protein TgHK011_000474 [Trichoderma gracile]
MRAHAAPPKPGFDTTIPGVSTCMSPGARKQPEVGMMAGWSWAQRGGSLVASRHGCRGRLLHSGPGGSAPRLREEARGGLLAAAKRRPAATLWQVDNELQQIGGASCGLRGHIVAGPIPYFFHKGRCHVPLLVASLASHAAEPTVHVLRLALHGLMPLCLRYAVHLPSTLRQTANLAHRERGGPEGQRKARGKEAARFLFFAGILLLLLS